MLYRYSDDYSRFRCLADRCPKSCCEGWQIVIDDRSLARYKKDGLSGIDWEEECFLQNGERCSMLLASGLCKLQCEHGESYLCDTCRNYPRHTEEYEGEREFSLSLSCPEAARMLLTRTEPMTFTEQEDDTPDDFEEFDYLLYSKLCDAREVCYRIIRNRTLPIRKRLTCLLLFCDALQECIDSDRICDMDEVIANGENTDLPEFLKEPETDSERELREFDILFQLERLTDSWVDWLNAGVNAINRPDFPNLRDAVLAEYSIPFEQILMFFFYTYFLGAVYDDRIFSKAALGVYSVLWIAETFLGVTEEGAECEHYPKLGQGLSEKFENLIETAYRYAREIEHSDENLNALEDYFDEMRRISR